MTDGTHLEWRYIGLSLKCLSDLQATLLIRETKRGEMVGTGNQKDLDALASVIGLRAASEALTSYSLFDLVCLDRRSLLEIAHIGPRKADAIQALPDLLERMTNCPVEGISVSCSRDVYDMYRLQMGVSLKERFLVLTLNSRNIILSEEECAVGTVNMVHINPSDVLRQAVLRAGTSVLCLHNHPSGDPSPSPEDRALTDRIGCAAALMGIRFLDHIIIAHGSFYSFSDAGAL